MVPPNNTNGSHDNIKLPPIGISRFGFNMKGIIALSQTKLFQLEIDLILISLGAPQFAPDVGYTA